MVVGPPEVRNELKRVTSGFPILSGALELPFIRVQKGSGSGEVHADFPK